VGRLKSLVVLYFYLRDEQNKGEGRIEPEKGFGVERKDDWKGV
jgi:hypothetical protein